MEIIFCGGVYFGEYTYQPESVKFGRHRRPNDPQIRLQKFVGKPQRGFRQTQTPPQEPAAVFRILTDDGSVQGIERYKRSGDILLIKQLPGAPIIDSHQALEADSRNLQNFLRFFSGD